MSMATYSMLFLQVSGAVASQASTSATVRPSAWPSRPPVPSASTNPVCHRSRVSIHLPVAGSCSQRGRPRRVSSMPSTFTLGSGASVTSCATVRKASITVGQDRRRSRAAWMTVEAASRMRRPAAPRSRMVIRAPAGICGICSVKDRRGQPGSRHHQRRLCQRNSSPLSPYGRSRGRVTAEPFTLVANTPQAGHARALSSAVARWTRRVPSASARPGRRTPRRGRAATSYR